MRSREGDSPSLERSKGSENGSIELKLKLASVINKGNLRRLYLEELGYIRKWLLIAILIGLVSGTGAVIFYEVIKLCSKIFLEYIAGYIPPTPAGEGNAMPSFSRSPILIPLATTLGGLLSGILVYSLAPEAEGHGTDAAIDAFHNRKGEIRSRVPIVKLIASAITIGSGGSAGREGPVAQIGAGFGSFLGKLLHLEPRDRRIAVAVGMGSGIGSIFKAPFGGALLAAEILYTNDFEVEVLFPAFIASVIGYVIFSYVEGWAPIFSSANITASHDLISILLYAVLGITCGLVGIIYVRVFYGVRDLFKSLSIPNYVKPAIGGLLTGTIGMFFPQVLGTGYGWLQMLMNEDLEFIPILILPILIGLKILVTSFSIGSGGSGGIFAPALVIGGFLGATIWFLFKSVFPGIQIGLSSFVIVGMMAFFGGVGKVPVAVMLMVSEMTGTYVLLVPSMVATSIAYVITGRNTIYRSQVRSKVDSPAHRKEYLVPIFKRLKVKDYMSRSVITVGVNSSLLEAMEKMTSHDIGGLPVLDEEGNLVGIVTRSDISQIPLEDCRKCSVRSMMSRNLVVTYPEEDLEKAFMRMLRNQIGRLPVVEPENPKKLVGIITREDIMRAYKTELARSE